MSLLAIELEAGRLTATVLERDQGAVAAGASASVEGGLEALPGLLDALGPHPRAAILLSDQVTAACVDAPPTAGLPPALQRFRFGAGVTRGGDGPSDGPRILFPPDGAVVELPRDADSRLASLALKAEGGEAPLRWLVNGQPVEGLRRRNDAFWLPDGEGYAEIVVIDAANRRARADVLLR